MEIGTETLLLNQASDNDQLTFRNLLTTFQRKIEGLSPFDPVAVATGLCKHVQISRLKHF